MENPIYCAYCGMPLCETSLIRMYRSQFTPLYPYREFHAHCDRCNATYRLLERLSGSFNDFTTIKHEE